MAKTRVLICPYCGETQEAGERCRACGGLFEPLSRQATHNAMGPWFIRNPHRPFQPGCSYETMLRMVERQQVDKYSILRGPTTKQFWTVAKRVPGISHLLGYCHHCDASVDPEDHGCHACGVPFGAYLDRNYLGLPEIRALPWEAGTEEHDREAGAPLRTIEDRRGQWSGSTEAVGISSFASDAELMGRATSPWPSFPPSPPMPPLPHGEPHATQAVSGFSEPFAASTGDANIGLGAPAVPVAAAGGWAPTMPSPISDAPDPIGTMDAASDARVRQQRKTIRLLIIALVALAAATIVSIALMLNRSG